MLSCRKQHDPLYHDIYVSRASTCKLHVCLFIFCICYYFGKSAALVTFSFPWNYAFILPKSHLQWLIWIFVQAYKANVICPNKHQAEQEKFYNNHLLESETYIGGHVECLESGVFRSDLPTKFQLDPSGYEVIGLLIWMIFYSSLFLPPLLLIEWSKQLVLFRSGSQWDWLSWTSSPL